MLFVVAGGWALTPADRGIQVTADVSKPGKIRLEWPSPTAAPTQYRISRRGPGDSGFTLLATLDGGATSYEDAAVVDGLAYEYELKTNDYNRFGILLAGRDVPAVDHRGVLILIVDETQSATLSAELNRLRQDLVGDGWRVVRHDVPRDDLFVSSGALQRQVKSLIQSDVAAFPGEPVTIFLFGRVPVPYSGYLAPDGHTNHYGAWPADVYYGEWDGSWTDVTVSTDVVGRRRNMPGDGKFDQSSIPSGTVEAAVGRVDFSNMPAFSLSETELLRQYLDKDHEYRWGLGDFAGWERRALMRDGFGDFSGEAFAANGWRAFAACFGTGTVTAVPKDEYMSTLATDRYLWSYGNGGGSYTSASGVGTTADFAASNPKTVFALLFGSYFGDWDSTNNFLRAPLATSYGLASIWAGRPNVYFHRMALGGTLGESVRFTWERSGGGSIFERYVHTALMGDPALRLHVVPPPDALSAVLADDRPRLSWSASSDPEVAGYYVDRALDANGSYQRVSGAAPWGGLSWTDAGAAGGRTYTYRVRAAKRESSGGGTYWNASQGLFASITTPPDPNPPPPVEDPRPRAYPNPWRPSVGEPLTFRGVGMGGELHIYSVTGELIRSLTAAADEVSWDGRSDGGSRVASGIYLYRIRRADGSRTKGKFAVLR